MATPAKADPVWMKPLIWGICAVTSLIALVISISAGSSWHERDVAAQIAMSASIAEERKASERIEASRENQVRLEQGGETSRINDQEKTKRDADLIRKDAEADARLKGHQLALAQATEETARLKDANAVRIAEQTTIAKAKEVEKTIAEREKVRIEKEADFREAEALRIDTLTKLKVTTEANERIKIAEAAAKTEQEKLKLEQKELELAVAQLKRDEAELTLNVETQRTERAKANPAAWADEQQARLIEDKIALKKLSP